MYRAITKITAFICQRLHLYRILLSYRLRKVRYLCRLKHHKFILGTSTFIASAAGCVGTGNPYISITLAIAALILGLRTSPSLFRATLFMIPPVLASFCCLEFLHPLIRTAPDKHNTQKQTHNTQKQTYNTDKQTHNTNKQTLILLNQCGTTKRCWQAITSKSGNATPGNKKILLVIRGSSSRLADLSAEKIIQCRGQQESVWSCQFYPWEFNLKRYAQAHDCSAVLSCPAKSISVPKALNRKNFVEKPWQQILAFTDTSRSKLLRGHQQNLGQTRGNLLTSLILGEHAALVDHEIQEKFRVLGLTHLIAASGFNISLVLVLAATFSRLLIPSRVTHTAISLSALAFFVMMAGASSSVERAAIMATCVIGAQFCYRTPYLPGILFFSAALTLLIAPGQLLDIGFQLSYLATFALVCIGSGLPIPSSCPKAVNWLIQTIITVCCAQLFVLPVQLNTFASCSHGFLLANLVVAPLIPPITMLGFLSSLGLLFQDFIPGLQQLAQTLDWLCGLGIDLVLYLTNLLSLLFPSSQPVGSPPWLICFLFYAILLFAKLHHHLTGKALPFICAVVFALSLLFIRQPLPDLTVISSASNMIFINAGHQAWQAGEIQAKQTRQAKQMTAIINHFALISNPQEVVHAKQSKIRYIAWHEDAEPALLIEAKPGDCQQLINSFKPAKHSLLIIKLKNTEPEHDTSKKITSSLVKALKQRSDILPCLLIDGNRYVIINTRNHIISGGRQSQTSSTLAFTVTYPPGKITYSPP